MLAQTTKTAESARVVKRQIFQIVIVDSTLQDKAIALLADSNQAAPNQAGCRDGPVSESVLQPRGAKLAVRVGRYAHAKTIQTHPRQPEETQDCGRSCLARRVTPA